MYLSGLDFDRMMMRFPLTSFAAISGVKYLSSNLSNACLIIFTLGKHIAYYILSSFFWGASGNRLFGTPKRKKQRKPSLLREGFKYYYYYYYYYCFFWV